MTAALLDVNVIVALTWPNHVHHRSATAWFAGSGRGSWAACPITESGFVRVSSNSRALPNAGTPAEAIGVLRQLRTLPGHEFWPDDVSLADCDEIELAAVIGSRQITDAHLLALAVRRGGRLVTFDRSIVALASDPRYVVMLKL